MARVKVKDTAPEVRLRSVLHRQGFRFRLNRKDLPGKPDIVLPKYKAVIFVHGCFWHGHDCKRGQRPKTNEEFWNKKIDGNMNRDELNVMKLKGLGWRVLIVWECEIKNNESLLLRLNEFMYGENAGS